MDKNKFKEQCLQLFINGETLSEISKLTGKSRTYITNLIKDDENYINIKQNRKIKVYKRKNYKQMTIHIPTEFIKGIGVTEDKNKTDFVNVFYDKEKKQIIIKKSIEI